MKARGSLTARLGRLEGRTAASCRDEPERRDEAGWLAVFERLDREGYTAAEPDFPAAVAELRDVLARARASADPPFDRLGSDPRLLDEPPHLGAVGR